MEPVYRHIDFCSDPETLWRKIQSGIWDWLGVKADGRTFVLGSPRRKTGLTFRASPTVYRGGAKEGEHGVRVHVPLAPGPSVTWCNTEQEAKEEFAREVDSLSGDESGPKILKVDRLERRQVVEEKFIVSRTSTYR